MHQEVLRKELLPLIPNEPGAAPQAGAEAVMGHSALWLHVPMTETEEWETINKRKDVPTPAFSTCSPPVAQR